jgi:heme/copper-type cytochrome/quinol oxidase subunit 2
MKSMNPRRAVAVGTLVCVFGAGYAMAGFSLRADGPRLPPSSARPTTADPNDALNQAPNIRSVTVTASRYRFDPPVIEVFQDDVVKIALRSTDIAHSLTIDAYRIAKRVSPAQPLTFEFRADQAGTFPYYCNLQLDDGCRQMRGQLVVKPRR